MLMQMRHKRNRKFTMAVMWLAVFSFLMMDAAPLLAADGCVEIDDMPLDIQIDASPPNIMFVIDDSGSMDWEFMTPPAPGEDASDKQGKFADEDGDLISYIHDVADNFYGKGDNNNGQVLGVGNNTPYTRADYRATLATYNYLYYSPDTEYKPWPSPDGVTDTNPGGRLPNADVDTPKSNPTVWKKVSNDPDDPANAYDLNAVYHTFGVSVAGIVVDDGDWNPSPPGFVIDKDDTGYAEDGDWTNSNGLNYYGASKSRYTQDATNSDITWEYTGFTGGDKGTYDVYGWWSCWDTRDVKAEFTITHKNGNDVVEVDQSDNTGMCGQWVSLGQYDFSGTGTVVLDRTHSDGQEPSTVGDAIWFVDPGDVTEYGIAYQETGNWTFSGSPDPNTGMDGNEDARYTETEGDSATWRHYFTADDQGEYVVQAYWPCYNNRDEYAQFTVTHDGGTDTVTVNQREGTGKCGEWVTLGTYNFTKSTYGEVTVTRTASSNGSSTVADAIRFVDGATLAEAEATESIDIINAHYYYESDDGHLYLVNLTDPIEYYQIADTHANVLTIDDLTELDAASVPSDVVVSDRAEARQNFANWFTYYRRRSLITVAAVADVITQLDNVYIGLAGVNAVQESVDVGTGIAEPCLPVGVDGKNYRSTLLSALYKYDQITGQASTPMRIGLVKLGEYFNRKTTDNDSNRGQGTGKGVKLSYHNIKGKYPELFTSVDTSEPINGDKGACQQNFVVLMTDGYYNGGSPGVGNVDDNDVTVDGYQISGRDPFEDKSSNTLGDVAMKFYAYDLADDIDDRVPKKFPDMVDFQHLVTYTITFGVTGALNPDDYNPYSDDSSEWPTWPSPINDYWEKVDDMYHGAVNGRGEFHAAQNPEELVEAFLAVMRSILDRIGTGASASVSGQELTTDTRLYSAGYNTDGWAGVVRAHALNGDTGAVEEEVWNAATQLEKLVGTDGANHLANRKIATYDGDGSDAAEFKTTWTTNRDASLTDDVINYLRGDKSNEARNGGNFRNRLTVWEGDTQASTFTLGDMVHSSPFFHDGVIYVGGNDGMLHAFLADGTAPADDGTGGGGELWAYVPSHVHGHLAELSEVGYSHKYYVDQTPTIYEIPGVMTLLVGGLGKGGKGYYALDVSSAKSVTDPTSVFQWEFNSDNSDADMGYSFSRAFIVKASNGDWVVIFGNGYDSQNEEAVLFVLNATTGALARQPIKTGVAGCNGLSSPFPADVDRDGDVDYIYAGDLKGNMWKFDATGAPSTWDVANGGNPLFTAKDASGNPQPITGRPDVTEHCSGVGQIVIFGTGQFLGEPDMTDDSLQTVYGVWDYGDIEDSSEYVGTFSHAGDDTLASSPAEVPNTATLLKQSSSEVTTGGETYRVFTSKDAEWPTVADLDEIGDMDDPSKTEDVNMGWYFDLPDSKERMINDVLIRSGKALFVTNIPAKEGGVCSVGAGSSWLHLVDPCTGGAIVEPVFDVNGDGIIDEADMVDNPNYDPDCVGDDCEPEKIGVTAPEIDDMVQTPAVVSDGEADLYYRPCPDGNCLDPIRGAGVDIGMTFWRQHIE